MNQNMNRNEHDQKAGGISLTLETEEMCVLIFFSPHQRCLVFSGVVFIFVGSDYLLL